ncbi:MAG TPA: DUF481 domain-containing protein [Bacteroidales bacterium]
MNTRITFALLLLIGFWPALSYGQKTDTIVMVNGNIITGDLKKIVYGQLSYSVEGMNTISIDEVDISSIKSKKQFEIKLTNDSIYYGSFDTARLKQMTYIVMDSVRKLINMRELVEVYPIKSNFWLRTSGNFSLGYNLTKSNKNMSFVSSGDLTHRKKKSFFELQWNNNLVWYVDTLNSSSNQAALTWQRTIKKEWSGGLAFGYDQNSELGVQARYGITLSIIRDFIYNSWNRLSAGAGFDGTEEWDYGESGSSEYIAGMLTLAWKVYHFKEPKISVTSNITYLPYINDKRNRVNINLAPNLSVYGNNLKVGFSLYYNYDSAPPSDKYSTTDYGLNLTFSYSFH